MSKYFNSAAGGGFPSQAGFTLIELLVVTAIIGILAALSLPYFGVYMLKGNLSQAQPYLMQIASKERIYKLRNGSFYISTTYKEQDLEDNLGVDLRDARDFCFMVVCKANCTDGAAAATTSANYVASTEAGDPAIEFEVWAIMRRSNVTTVAGPSGTCTVATDKLQPEGWVQSTGQGSEGKIAVLRYPQPPDGQDAITGTGGVKYDWTAGISFSHALAP